jgi:hypothetical protein
VNWIRGAALRPVSPWAVVPPEIVQQLAEELSTAGEEVRTIVDRAYRDFDGRQPIISNFVAERINALGDPTAVALGYFLSITVFMMFERAFGVRVREVNDEELSAAKEALDSEDELRQKDPGAWITSEDVVTSHQPSVLAFVRQHLDAALEDDPSEDEAAEDDEEPLAESDDEESDSYDDTMGEPLGVMGWPGLDTAGEEGAEPRVSSVSREELGAVYDAVLVEIVALSQAVDPPGHKTLQEDGEQEPQA